MSWVQAWRSSLSPPEVTISLSPGLISLNHTHLPLIILLSCSPSSWTIYTPHSRPSAWLNCRCEFVCLCDQHAGDTCTVLLFYVSQLPNCFVFWPCWPFGYLLKPFFPAFGPRLWLTVIPLTGRDRKFVGFFVKCETKSSQLKEPKT